MDENEKSRFVVSFTLLERVFHAFQAIGQMSPDSDLSLIIDVDYETPHTSSAREPYIIKSIAFHIGTVDGRGNMSEVTNP